MFSRLSGGVWRWGRVVKFILSRNSVAMPESWPGSRITCGVMALRAYERQQAAQRVLLAAEVSRDLFHAMQGLRLERGAVSIALTKPGVPSAGDDD